jgi:hypothetical protein
MPETLGGEKMNAEKKKTHAADVVYFGKTAWGKELK